MQTTHWASALLVANALKAAKAEAMADVNAAKVAVNVASAVHRIPHV